MKRAQPQSMLCIAGMAAILLLWSEPVLAQSDPPPPGGASRGENFSAKPAPQLFATDCTGSGCHKGPQGLGKNYGQFGLTTFLREHYTNSRQSAAALADYLLRTPGAAEARNPRNAPNAQSRAAARPDEVAPGSPSPVSPPAGQATRRAAEPNDGKPAPGGRHQRGRQTTATTPTAATPTAATPTETAPTPEPTPPPEPPAPPAPKQYDIFD